MILTQIFEGTFRRYDNFAEKNIDYKINIHLFQESGKKFDIFSFPNGVKLLLHHNM